MRARATRCASPPETWPAFAEQYGPAPSEQARWEVEALDPAELRHLLRGAIELHIDRAALARQIEAEQRERIKRPLARRDQPER